MHPSTLARVRAALLSPAARPLRFLGTGAAAALVQLGLLALMTGTGRPDVPANVLAFLLAAQVNFALSSTVTWRDRRGGGSLGRRWLRFHGSIAATALLNFAVFAVARTVMPALAASALGILVGAAGNYMAGEMYIFRSRTQSPSHTRRYVA